MKRSRFTEEQIAFALKQAELGTKVEEICRKIGISDATFYKWRQKYGGLGPSELRRLRQPKMVAHSINQIWSMDFVADNLFDGRKLRMLTVVDCCSRESLAIHVGQSLKGEDVVRVLNRIVHEHGQPQTIKSDNGSEFISKVMVESFNGRLRQECLNEHWFMSLADAQDKIEAWRRHYNEARPHSALDWRTPMEFARQTGLKPGLSDNKEPEILTSER